MENINLEITLNHSPFYDNLLVELQSVAEQKKKILRRVKSQGEIDDKLSFTERQILKHLMNKENEILMQLIELKGWSLNSLKKKNKVYNSAASYEDREYYRPEFFNY